jgi:hypothetical protein
MYSLGNFASHQPELPRRSSLLLYLGLTRPPGQKARVHGVRYVPLHVRQTGERFLSRRSIASAGRRTAGRSRWRCSARRRCWPRTRRWRRGRVSVSLRTATRCDDARDPGAGPGSAAAWRSRVFDDDLGDQVVAKPLAVGGDDVPGRLGGGSALEDALVQGSLYRSHSARAVRSAGSNFHRFSGSSRRACNRSRCSSLPTWRKHLMIATPLSTSSDSKPRMCSCRRSSASSSSQPRTPGTRMSS